MDYSVSPLHSVTTPEENRELQIALFGALCLFFSTLEYLIPKPLPFFRLGLANLPILLAFPLFSGRDIVLLTILKVLGQALINGTLASYVFLFSLTGSVASVVVMYIAWIALKPWISFVGISLLGALASNTVQIALSISFIFGTTAWVIAPFFMGLGLVAGLAVGMSAQVFSERSLWYRNLVAGNVLAPVESDNFAISAEVPKKRKRKFRLVLGKNWDLLGRTVSAELLFWTGLVILPAYLFQSHLLIRCVEALLFAFLALCAGKRLSLLYFATIIVSVTFFNLLAPVGQVLFSLGGFSITEHALKDGVFKGVGIVGLVMISLATVRGTLRLPGTIGRLLGNLFRFYEIILVTRTRIELRHFVASIDRILIGLSRQASVLPEKKERQKTQISGWFFVCTLVLMHWGALFVQI